MGLKAEGKRSWVRTRKRWLDGIKRTVTSSGLILRTGKESHAVQTEVEAGYMLRMYVYGKHGLTM